MKIASITSLLLCSLIAYSTALHGATRQQTHTQTKFRAHLPMIIGVSAGVVATVTAAGWWLYAKNQKTKQVAQAKKDALEKFKKDGSEIIKEIAILAQQNLPKKPVIAIAGAPGSGKSYFAQQLKDALAEQNVKAAIFDFNRFDEHNKHNHIYGLHNILSVIMKRDSQAIMDLENYSTCPWNKKQLQEFADADVILFEGNYVLRNDFIYPNFSNSYDALQYSTIRIFIDVASWETLHDRWMKQKFSAPEKHEEYRQRLAEYNAKFTSAAQSVAHYLIESDGIKKTKAPLVIAKKE